MADLIHGLASVNRYKGKVDPRKAKELSEKGLAAFEMGLHEKLELSHLNTGLKLVEREQVMAELRASKGPTYDLLMRVGYSINATERDALHILPIASGAMMVIGNSYHLRFLKDFCGGNLVEVRDVEGSYVRPRLPAKGQIGYDCTSDRSVYDGPLDEEAVLKSLAPRQDESPTDQLVWKVFPNSSRPLVRETRTNKEGCRVRYLSASPDENTCSGVRYKIAEIGGETCCTASDCDFDASFYFHSFMDALSVRDMVAVKSFIQPGGALVVDGNVVSSRQVLRANTSGAALKRFTKEAPGWAGGDTVSCVEDGPSDRDQEESDTSKAPETAECTFGGGGTHFRAELQRPPKSQKWYVLRLHGEMH